MFDIRNGENTKSASYLWCKNIEVPSPVGTADELAFVLGRNSRIFGNPDHGGAQSISVQV